jgi:high-affinity iron transporter
MISSLLLSLREGLEAALIIGIVLGALRKTGRSGYSHSIWAGVIIAAILSLLSAFLLRAVGEELEGVAEQIFEGVTLLLAAGVLTWMIFWMRRQSRNMRIRLETSVYHAANLGSGGALFLLAFISVLREGIELALFLTAASLTSSGLQTIIGAAIGLCFAFILGYLIYTTTLLLNLQRFFQVTAVVLVLFSAGLIAHSVAEFNAAGIIPAIISPIWNLNPILDDRSFVGMIFRTLFGYHGTPSLTEALGYSGYILATLIVFVKTRKLQPV